MEWKSCVVKNKGNHKADALAVWHSFWDAEVSMTERQQLSCTSDRGQQSVWDKPPAIVTICQSIKNKTHAFAYTKLVPGSNWNALVCSVYKNVGEQANLHSPTISSKGYLSGLTVLKEELFLCLCGVLWSCLVAIISWLVWTRALPLYSAT